MSKISEQKALEEYPKETYYDRDVCDYIDVNATRRDGYIKGYDQAMQDFLENAIIAYCEVCKMPNCVMQKQKEICPYLSKFRRCLNSLLNNSKTTYKK